MYKTSIGFKLPLNTFTLLKAWNFLLHICHSLSKQYVANRGPNIAWWHRDGRKKLPLSDLWEGVELGSNEFPPGRFGCCSLIDGIFQLYEDQKIALQIEQMELSQRWVSYLCLQRVIVCVYGWVWRCTHELSLLVCVFLAYSTYVHKCIYISLHMYLNIHQHSGLYSYVNTPECVFCVRIYVCWMGGGGRNGSCLIKGKDISINVCSRQMIT